MAVSNSGVWPFTTGNSSFVGFNVGQKPSVAVGNLPEANLVMS